MSDPPVGDPWDGRPDRSPLLDEDGQVVLVFSLSESTHGAIPWADGVWVPPTVPTGRAVELALQAMPGWRLSTSDPTLAEALVTAGGTERRHAHTRSHSLIARAMPTDTHHPGLQIAPLTPAQANRQALTLGAINLRAYPRGHPDAFDGDEAAAVSQIRAIARGEMLGPMMAESRVALVDGRIVGACLVVDRSGDPPNAGAWIIDIFRDPDCPARGVGTALLSSVLRAGAASGLPGLSLAVSHDNCRARRLYTRLGFVDVDESWTLALPEEDERPRSLRPA